MKDGILLVNKPRGQTAFTLVRKLRKLTGIRKIGHAGTLDPFATGVMIMLIGREYTRLSDQFLCQDKAYTARLKLGIATDTYDCDGTPTSTSDYVPPHIDLSSFQGTLKQIPPMYSAKKINGQKLYTLARQGKTIERKPHTIHVQIELQDYSYPYVDLQVSCSKGTYIRSLAHDLGQTLGCGAHLTQLERTRSGLFHLKDCLPGNLLDDSTFDITPFLTYPKDSCKS